MCIWVSHTKPASLNASSLAYKDSLCGAPELTRKASRRLDLCSCPASWMLVASCASHASLYKRCLISDHDSWSMPYDVPGLCILPLVLSDPCHLSPLHTPAPGLKYLLVVSNPSFTFPPELFLLLPLDTCVLVHSLAFGTTCSHGRAYKRVLYSTKEHTGVPFPSLR